jgi:tetratricopeptide (TPR) repeat protein
MSAFISRGLCLLLLSVSVATGQSARSLISEGNDQYEDKKYSDAEINYRRAIDHEEGALPGHFNLGNALHRQGQYDQSAKEFDASAGLAADPSMKAEALYNRGNSFVEAGQYEQAVKSYVESLKLHPSDPDTKYNLSYALKKLKEKQQQQQGGGQDRNNQQDQQENQQDKEQSQNKQGQDRRQQDQEKNQPQNQDRPEGEQPQQQAQMSRADAERILEVLKNQEKDVQKKLRAKARSRAKTEKDW